MHFSAPRRGLQLQHLADISTGPTRFTNPNTIPYASLEGAIEVFTHYPAKELGPRGITVNAVAPGAIATDFSGGTVRDNPQVNKVVAVMTALGRVGEPEDIGMIVSLLFSDENRWEPERPELPGTDACCRWPMASAASPPASFSARYNAPTSSRRPSVPSPTLASLFLFVLVSTVSPGGATTLATASGASFGYRRSLPLIAGIAAGLGSMAASAAAGLSGVLLALPSLQFVMKVVGSVYLLWIAMQLMRRGAPNPAVIRAGVVGGTSGSTSTRTTGFAGGVWMLWHNPKAWAMTMGAAASFTALANGPTRLGVLLGTTFGVCAFVSLSLWCLAGLLLGRLLRTAAHWRALNTVLGLLLAASILPIWL